MRWLGSFNITFMNMTIIKIVNDVMISVAKKKIRKTYADETTKTTGSGPDLKTDPNFSLR